MSDELAGAFEAIEAHAAKVFGMDLFAIALCGPDAGHITYELLVEQGVRQARQVRPLGDGLSDLVLRTKGPIMVRCFELESGCLPLSWMGAPLVVGDRVLGLIVVQCLRQGAFEEKSLPLLSILASWAATAVEYAGQLQQKRAEAEACKALLRAGRDVERESNGTDIFKAIVEAVPALVECHICSVWSWSEEKREFRSLWRSRGFDGSVDRFGGALSHPQRAVAVQEMISRRDVVVVPAGEEWRLGEYGGLRPSEPRSVALVPLIAEGEVLGQVVVEAIGDGGFPPLQVDMLRELADMASLALRREPRNAKPDGEGLEGPGPFQAGNRSAPR